MIKPSYIFNLSDVFYRSGTYLPPDADDPTHKIHITLDFETHEYTTILLDPSQNADLIARLEKVRDAGISLAEISKEPTHYAILDITPFAS